MATKSLNKVMIIGNLGADPELRYTSNGQAVATFNVATSDSWTDANGQAQERTEWHRVVAWAKLGEIVGEYLTKGGKVYVEGKLQTRTWDDQNGVKRYTTEINARDIILLGGRGEGAQGGRPPHPADSYAPGAPTAAPTHTGPAAAKTNAAPPAPDAMPEDDIPF